MNTAVRATTRVLVTNDDGIDSPGLWALAGALRAVGFVDIVIAAPDSERSGASASLGVNWWNDGVGVERRDHDGFEAYALDAPPALVVLSSFFGLTGARPGLVVSGVNPGFNTGWAVLHSGTVGAALTAGNAGIAAVAVSRAWGTAVGDEAAATVGATVAAAVAESGQHAVINVNVPAGSIHEFAGAAWADLADAGPINASMRLDANGRARLVLDEEVWRVAAPDTDQGLVQRGWVALSALRSVGAHVDNDHPGVRLAVDQLLASAP